MEVYEDQGVVFLGIEQGLRNRPSFTGNIISPKDFVEKMSWTFPNGIDRDNTVYNAYNANMDI